MYEICNLLAARYPKAKKAREIEMRRVWVKQYEKEIAAEVALPAGKYVADEPDMTDDELLAELNRNSWLITARK